MASSCRWAVRVSSAGGSSMTSQSRQPPDTRAWRAFDAVFWLAPDPATERLDFDVECRRISVLPGFVWVEIRRSKPFVCKAWEFGPGFLRRGALGGRDQQDPQVPPPKTPHPLPLFSVPSHNAAQRSRLWLPSPPRRSRPCPTSLSSLDSWLSPTPGGSNGRLRPRGTAGRSLAGASPQCHLHLSGMWHSIASP